MLSNVAVFVADLFHCLESLGFDNFQASSIPAVPSSATVVSGFSCCLKLYYQFIPVY
jgi:hypothetical protein